METYTLTKAEALNLLKHVVLDEDLDEIDIKISSGAQKGDGYLSCLNRVDVVGKKGKYHYVVKIAPKAEIYRTVAKIERFYIREVRFYKEAFPEMLQFQIERKVKEPFNSVPKFFTSCLDEGSELLMLENIRSQGFDLWDRQQPMDDNHLKIIFREYGKFHAVSYAMRDQKPELFEKISENLPNFFLDMLNENTNRQIYDITLDGVMKLFTKPSEQPVIAALHKLKENLQEIFELANVQQNTFVLAHGDCWCNNMMFKYEDPANPKRPTQMRLLDFQLFFKASPVHDLSYSFYTASSESSLKHFNDYLRIYYESLSCHAKNLGTDVKKYLTYSQLRADWKRYSGLAYAVAVMVTRVMYTEQEEVPDASDTEKEYDVKEAFGSSLKNDEKIFKKQKALTKFMFDNKFF